MVSSAKQARSVYCCTECDYESPKWLGRCPECASWNSFAERAKVSNGARASAVKMGNGADPVEIAALAEEDEARLPIGIPEFDRVLGGGVVAGALVLIGGDPGIGKSTLLLQAASRLTEAGRGVLYISGEESVRQVKMRAGRMGLTGARLFILTETNLSAALAHANALSPSLVIIDSIQTVHSESREQAPGSMAQLRQCTMELMRWAKETGVPAFLVGHVTKDGDIAGPRQLEHIVDVVLYLEGERFSSYRLLRGVKNRFGAIDEVGVFEMTSQGMRGVENPSELFISERVSDGIGSVVLPTIEGSRPMLVEVQALTSPTVTPAPRRTANGLDMNRLLVVSAVLSRRLGENLGQQDIIASVVGGLRVVEPAADLAVALTVLSSQRDRAVAGDLVAFGEVGLSGEIRSVAHLDRRLSEAARLGFRRCIVPAGNATQGSSKRGLDLLPAVTLRDAVRMALQ